MTTMMIVTEKKQQIMSNESNVNNNGINDIQVTGGNVNSE